MKKNQMFFWSMMITTAIAWVIITAAIREYRASIPVPEVVIIPLHKEIGTSGKVLGPIVLMYDSTNKPEDVKKNMLHIFKKVKRILMENGWTEAPYLPEKEGATSIKVLPFEEAYDPCVLVRDEGERMQALIPRKTLEVVLPATLPR